MSDRRTFRPGSGRLNWTSLQGFWGPTRTARDPSIPNLPLETAGLSDIAGSASLTFSTSGTLVDIDAPVYVAYPGKVQVFRPPGIFRQAEYRQRRFTLFQVEAAPTGAMTASAAMTFAATGTVLGAGALTGSTTATFSPTATLGGSGALAGSSALTFATTATATGNSAIAGTTSLTFSTTAALAGSGVLAGTSPVAFSATATLSASGALAGTSPFAFSTTGTLDGPVTGLSGSVALLSAKPKRQRRDVWNVRYFDRTGVFPLPVSEVLIGSTALTFSTAATLGGAGALAGSAAMAFSTTGAMTGAVEATYTIYPGMSVSMSVGGVYRPDPYRIRRQTFWIPPVASGAITGAASLTFTLSGALAGVGALAGSAAMSFSTSGALSGGSGLEGTSSLAFSTAGALLGAGELAGTSSMVFAPIAGISGNGALAGAISASFSLTSVLANLPDGEIAGTSEMAFTASAVLSDVQPVTQRRGGGRPKYRKAHYEERLPSQYKRLEELVDDVSAEMAFKQIEATAPPNVKKQAKSILRPFTPAKSLVKTDTVDWAAVEADATKIGALLALWAAECRRLELVNDDEEWMMWE